MYYAQVCRCNPMIHSNIFTYMHLFVLKLDGKYVTGKLLGICQRYTQTWKD